MKKLIIDENKKNETIRLCEMRLDTQINSRKSVKTIIIEQAEYISPPFWLLQIVALLVAYLVSKSGTNYDLAFLIGPIIGLMAIPELFHDLQYGMNELEYSCRYSPAKVIGYRIIVIYILNSLFLLISAGLMMKAFSMDLLRMYCSVAFPYNITSGVIVFFVECLKNKSRSSIIIAAILGTVISNLLLSNTYYSIVTGANVYLWTFISYVFSIIMFKVLILERRKSSGIENRECL